jgi:hypothetical protein
MVSVCVCVRACRVKAREEGSPSSTSPENESRKSVTSIGWSGFPPTPSSGAQPDLGYFPVAFVVHALGMHFSRVQENLARTDIYILLLFGVFRSLE